MTGALKVGVTRSSNLLARWIDQGAIAGIPFAETSSRQRAGEIEVEMKQYVRDRTNWRTMLVTSGPPTCDLHTRKTELAALLSRAASPAISAKDTVTLIVYPGEQPTGSVKSVSLAKCREICGRLLGIKGQYLLFADGIVFNVRNHQGYAVEICLR